MLSCSAQLCFFLGGGGAVAAPLKMVFPKKSSLFRHFGSTATCLREVCPQGFARHPCAGEASTKQLAMLQHRSLLQRGGPCPTRICWQLLEWCVLRSGVTLLCIMAIYLIQVGISFFFEVIAFALLHDVALLWGFSLATLWVCDQSPGVYLVGKVTSLLDCANVCSFCSSTDLVQIYSGAGSPLIAHSRCDFSSSSCCSWLLSVLPPFAASAVCAHQSLLYLATVLSLAQHLFRCTHAASYALHAQIPALGIGSVRV